MLTRDKVNLEYICEYKSHFTSRFCEIELSLNSIS